MKPVSLLLTIVQAPNQQIVHNFYAINIINGDTNLKNIQHKVNYRYIGMKLEENQGFKPWSLPIVVYLQLLPTLSIIKTNIVTMQFFNIL